MPDNNNNNNNLNINTNVFTFKGQVKVAAVQAAFDALIGRINSIIDIYNTTDEFLQNQDYSLGGETLGAAGYTLTIGGIKQVLAAYNGAVFGCRAFRLSEGRVFITDGMIFTTARPIRIHSQIITEGAGGVLYYDPEEDVVKRTTTGDTVPEGGIFVTFLSTSSSDIYMNCFRGIQLEGLEGFNIQIKDRKIQQKAETVPTGKPHRFEGGGAYWADGSASGRMYFKGDEDTLIAAAYSHGNRRRHATTMPANFLFVPKGCDTPLTVVRKYMTRTMYTMVFNRGDAVETESDDS